MHAQLRLAHAWHAAKLGDLASGDPAAQDAVELRAEGDDAAGRALSFVDLAGRDGAGEAVGGVGEGDLEDEQGFLVGELSLCAGETRRWRGRAAN